MSYELYEPNQNYAPPPPPPPPRPSNAGWITLAIVAALSVPVLIVVGCGFSGLLIAANSSPSATASPPVSATASATPAARETIQPAGAPYRWQLPTGFVSANAPADLRGGLDNSAAAALTPGDSTNILLTGSAALDVDSGTVSTDALRAEVDTGVKALGHDPTTGQATSVHGYSAYRYDFTYAGAHAYSYFVFKGKTVVQVLCRWADRQDDVLRGCDDLLATLTII